MNKELLYHLLLRSLDEPLNGEEQLQLKNGLAHSAELRAEKEKLLKIRIMLENQQEAYHFKPFFAGRVMEKIRAEQSSTIQVPDTDFITALMLSFQRMAIPSFAVICIVLMYVYTTADTLSLQAIMGISDVTPEDLKLLNI
ncbi:MAG: hypothetical protein AB8B69_07015 [Chitinophagales bacterium]